LQIKIYALFLPSTLLLLIALLIFSFSAITSNIGYAHITKKFDNIILEVGWSNEPALAGDLNNAIIQVNQTSGKSNQTPVINALANMNILVKYGGVTKTLDFVPSTETNGLYNGQMIPTRVGSYSLVMNGTIQNQKISAEIPLDVVQSKQKLNFPDTAGGSAAGTTSTTANNNIGPQLQGIVSQLSTDIDTTKSSIDALAKNNADTQKSIQDLKNADGRSYMLGMGGLGAGIAGIVIASAALSRKELKFL
jgi:hypothetical protein